MHSKTLKRFLAYSLLLASLALPAVSARQQERPDRKAQPSYELPAAAAECPKPIALTLTAKNPPFFVAADFSPAQVAAPHMSGLGDLSINKNFLYTFQWKRDQRCCQVTKAILTVNMKANQSGQAGGSDASNDGIAIMHNGTVVAPYNEAIYSNVTKPFPLGQPVTKSWALNPAALNIINTTGNLDFAVQDDTGVVSATLQLWGCCLSTQAGPATEPAAITNSPN